MNPGRTIVVEVSASGGPFINVSAVAPGYAISSQTLAFPPYRFSFAIPVKITPGVDTITAVGTTVSGIISSAPLPIDIERPDSPDSISTNHTQLELRIGDEAPILVFGRYGDSSIVDLSKSALTKYVSGSAAVASTTADGVVAAVAPGATVIAVHHRNRQAFVKVTVVRNPR